MDPIKEYRRFINSHHFADGIRITAGVVLPALVLNYFGHLQYGIFASLGAVCASLTDSPGPIQHRRNGLLVCSGFVFVVSIAVGFSLIHIWIFMILLPMLCFFFSMIAVYGARAGSIGLATLLVMVMMTHESLKGEQVIYFALLLLGGALWYTLLSLLLYNIRPFRLIKQTIGEYVLSAGSYLRARAKFYEADADITASYEMLMKAQVLVQQKQEATAELLFAGRRDEKESSFTSRILMMMFLDVSDLLERTMASYFDYKKLHAYFDDTPVITEYHRIILLLAAELDEVGLAVVSGSASEYNGRIDDELASERVRLREFRTVSLNPENLEGFISLFQILDSMDDIAARIRTLHQYTAYDPALKNITTDTPDPSKYVSRQTIDPQQFWSNFSMRSNIFRHSLRISIAALIAYIIGVSFFPAHGYWIVLTVIIIIKPGYSLSKQRNLERLAGTLIGVALGWSILFFVKSNAVIFILFIVSMIGAYSFMRWKYLVSVVMVTLYVLFMFHMLSPADFSKVMVDRMIDTALGCFIGFVASFLLPPVWEREQIGEWMGHLIAAITGYFEMVAFVFTGQPYHPTQSAEKRKQAWVALANVSDAFARMLSEPKSKRKESNAFQQFVVLCHMLVSHLATLTYYAHELQPEYIEPGYLPLINASIEELKAAGQSLHDPGSSIAQQTTPDPGTLVDKKINALMRARRLELEQGQLETGSKKYLARFKSISDQFYFVYKNSKDLHKVCRELKIG